MNTQKYELTEIDLQILNGLSPDRLAEIYAKLNRWEWDAVLGDEPDKSEESTAVSISTTRRMGLLNWIASKIHPRLISRVWNSDMSDDEHAAWWRKHKKAWFTE